MPTKDELLGIVKTTEYPTPTIDNTWFPNTVEWYYWTSSPYEELYDDHLAWSVHFDYGFVSYDSRHLSDGGPYRYLVRLVR